MLLHIMRSPVWCEVMVAGVSVRQLVMFHLQSDNRGRRMLALSSLSIWSRTPGPKMMLPTFRWVFPPLLTQAGKSLTDMPNIWSPE